MSKFFAVFIPMISIIITTLFITNKKIEFKKNNKKYLYVISVLGILILFLIFFITK